MQPADHKKSVFDRLGNPIDQSRHRSQYARPVDWRYTSSAPHPKRYSSPYQPPPPPLPPPHIHSSVPMHHPDEFVHQPYYYQPQFRVHDVRQPHVHPMPAQGPPPMPSSRYDRYGNFAARPHQLAAPREPPSRWYDHVGSHIEGDIEQQCPIDNDKNAVDYAVSPQALVRSNRWRERRDAIINLDLQTAQSMSKTNSLKSSMQLHDAKRLSNKKQPISPATPKETLDTNQVIERAKQTTTTATSTKDTSSKVDSEDKRGSVTQAEISDGEIVDDTSDDEEAENLTAKEYGSYKREASEPIDATHDFGRKRRRYDNEDNSWELENISDDELEDLIYDKDANNAEKKSSISEGVASKQASSEAELLKSIGIDWSNLVQMAKQSKNQMESSQNRDSARSRFSLSVYLPELGISPELAGTELFEIVSKIAKCA